MTYFKYVKREAPQQVNWAEIGNDISTTLIAERDRREALKEQIDADTREIGKKFEEAPMGQSQTLNDWTLEGANSASQLMLQMEREMKAGRLDYKDYIKFRQNISDGVDNLYNVVTDYNTEFDRKLERAKTGQSSKVESYLMEQVEGFQNFSETGVYWDPMNGTAAIAKKQRDEEGNLTSAISDDPNDFASVQSLQSRIKKDYDRYDVEGNMATISESVGEELLVIREKGIATQADAMQKEAWEKAEDDLVGSVLTSPDNAISVLLDYAEQNPDGKEYFITFSEEEANKDASAILMKTDNNGNVYASFDHTNGKKQMKEAKEALKANLRIKLDRKQTMLEESSRVPTEAEYKRMDGLARDVSLANSLGKFYYGAEDEIASASGFIQGLEGNEDIIKIQRTPEALVVEKRVGEEGSREVVTKKFSFVVPVGDGKQRLLSQEEWIASVYTELTPMQNLDTAIANSRYRPDREFNADSRRSFDVNIRPDVQPLGDLQFEIGKDKLAFSDLFTVAEDSDADVLDIAVQDTERVLQQLPDELTAGSSYRVLNEEDLDDVAGSGAAAAVVIDMPRVLTAPIIVPKGDQFSAKMRSLVADLYTAAAAGKRRAPASYKNFFDGGEFARYNNENSAALYGYPEEALTGEVYSLAGTEATATDEFRVIDIEELTENNQSPAEVPSFDATPEGATPANEVDAAEEVNEVEDIVNTLLEELESETVVADTAMAETATVPADTAMAETATVPADTAMAETATAPADTAMAETATAPVTQTLSPSVLDTTKAPAPAPSPDPIPQEEVQTVIDTAAAVGPDTERALQSVAEEFDNELPKNPLEIALKYVNISEDTEEGQQLVTSAFESIVGDEASNYADSAWCAAFVNMVLRDSGATTLSSDDNFDKMRARQYANIGQDVRELEAATPKVGDIVVIEPEEGQFHVGFYVDGDPDSVNIFGGNQGDAVNVSRYPSSMVRHLRRIESAELSDSQKEQISKMVVREGGSTR